MIKYCPTCYDEMDTEETLCPCCGSTLEDPMTEDESEEMLELLTMLRA